MSLRHWPRPNLKGGCKMSIEGKHAYRFVFLRSDKWSAVRLEALLREKAKCQICKEESISNDAHHVVYPESVWDTTETDLIILCRPCHTLVHELLRIGVMSLKLDRANCIADFVRVIESLNKWRREKGEHLKKNDRKDGTRKHKRWLKENSACCLACRNIDRSTQPRNVHNKVVWPLCDDCWTNYQKVVPDRPPRIHPMKFAGAWLPSRR